MNKIIEKFRDVFQDYDAFIFDLWGVIYEGGAVFENALDVIKRLHQLNKPLLLMSNSPFLDKDCAKNLQNCGLPTDLYKSVITAGDICMRYLQATIVTPQKFYVIDKDYWQGWKTFNQLLQATTDIEEADAVLCLAVPPSVEFPEEIAQHFDGLFHHAIARRLTLICANPDLFAFSTGKLCLRPGLLTLRYQQLGGAVLNFGKPFPEIFQQGLKILNYPKRVLMVGDTEYTDIQGAARHNIDTMLITKLNKDNPIRSQAMYFSQEVKW